MHTRLPSDLVDWLEARADSLAAPPSPVRHLLPRLAGAKAFHAGVPVREGGQGGDLVDAATVVAAVAEHSLAAAAVACSQREFIELLLISANVAVREHCLPSLLDGSMAGIGAVVAPPPGRVDGEVGTVIGTDTGRGWRLNGRLLPWPNVEPQAYLLAVPVHFGGQAKPAVVLLSGDQDGLHGIAGESPEGLGATCPTVFELAGVHFREDELLGDNGEELVAVLGYAASLLRCGLPAGVARAALDAVQRTDAALQAPAQKVQARILQRRLDDAFDAIATGWRGGLLREDAAALAGLRTHLVRLACEAVAVERLVVGEKAPQASGRSSYARRQVEARLLAGV